MFVRVGDIYFSVDIYLSKAHPAVEKCQIIHSVATEPFLQLGDSLRGGENYYSRLILIKYKRTFCLRCCF